ncbi:DUF3131 domain-containing protein [Vibrio maerlii]|uniref:DUF3131 domain-containing protein n=1 Tax=Vibrio maerlii TaxID=2231648 RepID=UPI0013DEA679|nr:DUF3131 domain-containing protein [Vibrio maerlii]
MSGRTIKSKGLTSLCVLSFLSSTCLANVEDVSAHPDEEASFYGQRSVFHAPQTQQKQLGFTQRAIAPPIDKLTIDAQLESLDTISSPKQIPNIIQPLSRNERLLAKKAGYYFSRNLRADTGLWDSVQGYPYTTMWDIASGIAATLALEGLGMESHEQTTATLEKLLTTIRSLRLYKDKLPNREYSTKDALPAGRYSQSTSNGNGWSALDLGRLLIWLDIVTQYHPNLELQVAEIINDWTLELAVNKGTLFGTKLTKSKEYYRQEGRHGYLEYAAHGFRLHGVDVDLPDLPGFLKLVEIEGVSIQIDSRNLPYLTSDPLILAALEYGIDRQWNQLDHFYQLHKEQWLDSGVLTAYAEDAMNRKPWFAYNNVHYAGRSWVSVSPGGNKIDNPQTFSSKAAIGFSVLFNDNYSHALFNQVLDSSLTYRSIPTGIYQDGRLNTAFNINTNSLILVALWYKQRGNQPILNEQKKTE